MKVGIVGAGMAGLACASALKARGCEVEVLEKSRGLGGRLATRRTREGMLFDHGAPKVDARDPRFRAYLEGGVMQEIIRRWPEESGAYVGATGMSDLVRPLAEGLSVRLEVEAATVRAGDGGWTVFDGDDEPLGAYDAVVLTAPAPQSAHLTRELPEASAALSAVETAPVWTLLAAFDRPAPEPKPDEVVDSAWRALDKPGRDADQDRWVIHATRAWTEANLELEKPEAAAALLAHLQRGPWWGLEPRYVAGHRWRFGRTAKTVDRAYIRLAPKLFAGGDLSRGGDAEAAYLSGLEMAEAI